MKYLFINSVIGFGSTGRLVADKCHELMREGHECRVAWGRINTEAEANADITTYRIGSKLDNYWHFLWSRLIDAEGLCSIIATKKLLRYIDDYKPDVIWIHNLHGHYLNYPVLFRYIKSHSDIAVKMTLHDCWTMTGGCSHFMYKKCDKWKTGCQGRCLDPMCPPQCVGITRSHRNYIKKMDSFTGLKDMAIIVPSKWLASVVRESYLRDYPITVEYNQIDKSVFKPTASDFREKQGIVGKKVLLGITSKWNERKGLSDYVDLADRLVNKNVVVVLVGVSEKIAKKLSKNTNIICINRTNDATELAGIYTTADAYLNLTYEDNYPTTNLEANACGTPVITYRTGGSPESVPEEFVVEVGDLDGIIRVLYEHSIIN